MKIFGIVIGVIAVVVVVVLAYAATRPDRFEVQRSTSIRASADRRYSRSSTICAPSIPGTRSTRRTRTSRAPTAGRRAARARPMRSRAARPEPAASRSPTRRPPSRVTMRLTMSKPLAADNRVQFILQPQGDTTRVTWAMDGDVPFVGKLIHLFIDMDRMVGQEFAAGLAELKARRRTVSDGPGHLHGEHPAPRRLPGGGSRRAAPCARCWTTCSPTIRRRAAMCSTTSRRCAST